MVKSSGNKVMINLNIFKKAIYNLDKTLSALGLLLALILILASSIRDKLMYMVVGIIALFACAIYLYMARGNQFSYISGISELQTKRSIYLLLNILFFLTLCYSITSLYLRPDPYLRPLNYFISIILMVSILTVEILFLPRSKPHIYFVLLKTMLIPLSLSWSQLLIFPTVVGSDPWFHRALTQKILNSGFLPEGIGYVKLPVFHLISGLTSLITGLDYKMATMFSISLMQIICLVLFIFLLGRFIFNAKVGLLAALLLVVSNDFIWMSYWTIPNTLGIVLIPIIIYLLFKIKQDNSIIGSSFSILLMITLILTHTICSVGMAILLFTFWAGFKFYERISNEKRNIVITLSIGVFSVVAMFAWWTYASGHITNFTEMIKWGFGIDYFAHGKPVFEESAQYAHNIPLLELIFNYVGKYLFWGFSLIGCFYMISKKIRNHYSFNYAIGGVITLGIYLFAIVSLKGLLAFRWSYLTYVMLSIPLAVTLFLVSMKLRKNYMKALFVVTMVAALSFSMIMTPTANMDNPLFKDTAVRKQTYTQSELQAYETITKLTDKNIGTDGDVAGHLTRLPHFSGRLFSMENCFYTKDFFYNTHFWRGNEYIKVNYQNSITMVRKEISHSTITTRGQSFIKLDYEPEQVLTEDGFSCIYDSGSVSAFCWNSSENKSRESEGNL